MRLEKLENRRLLSIALPSIPSGTFLVTSYGAVANGSTNNATAIQSAITAAKNAGGGTVEFPAAPLSYESGPITLANNINFQVDSGAELQAIPFSSYPNATTNPTDFITASSKSNFEITGGGVIDGNGSAWWAAFNNGTITNRPRLIEISSCNTVLIQGLTLTNPAMFHIAFSKTNTVTVNNITINTSSISPNTDGIDPAGQHYLIENCSISTGDDNIAIKPQNVFCGDITVTNCYFGAGHGLSVGGETNLGLNGLTVTNCTFYGTTAGIRLKAERTEGGLVQNCSYSNITMTDVEYPININSYYNIGSVPTTPQEAPQPITSLTPIWQNISISNVSSSWDTTGGQYSNSYCGIIWGLPEEPINGITLTNVDLSAKNGVDVDHVRNMSFDTSSSFTPAVGNALISTKTAGTPYDAQIQEFSNIASDNQNARVVMNGAMMDFYSNGILQSAVVAADLVGLLINASGNNDNIVLDFSGGDFSCPVTVGAIAFIQGDTLSIVGASTSDPFMLDSSQVIHGSSTISFANIPNLSLSTGVYTLSADMNNAGLQIGNQALVQLNTVQHLSSLSLSGSGEVNIAGQSIFLAQTGSTADAAMFGLLQSAFDSGYAGSGVTSSVAVPQNVYDVGYYDTGTQIIIRDAYAGDANLDGSINSDDLSLVMLGQTEHRTDWFFGNFNYDAQVDADDWILLAKGAAEINAAAQNNTVMIATIANVRNSSDISPFISPDWDQIDADILLD